MTVPADTCDTSAARTARVVLITGAVQTGAAPARAAEAARAGARQAIGAGRPGDAPPGASAPAGAPAHPPRAGEQQAQAPSAPPAARPAPDAAAVGRALAVGFARRGWNVALAAAAGDEARAAAALAAEVEALGRRAAVLAADLAIEADVARLVADCGAALGRPACVIAQAAPVADTARDVGYASLAGAMARSVAAPLVLARTLADATPDAARDDERERAVVIHLLDETLFHPAPERLSHSLAQAAPLCMPHPLTGTTMFAALLHPRLADCRRLYLRNHEVYMNIGAFEHEKRGEQRVVINVDLFVPLALTTPVEDRLREVVDYDLMKQSVAQCVARGHIHLQETLCDAIAASLLAHDAVRAVRVSTEKPDAYPDCDAVGVEVFRIKDEERA